MRLNRQKSRNRRRFAMRCGFQGFHYVRLDASYAYGKQRKAKTREWNDKEKRQKGFGFIHVESRNEAMELCKLFNIFLEIKSKYFYLEFRYFRFVKLKVMLFIVMFLNLTCSLVNLFTEILRIILFVTIKSFKYMFHFFS